MVFFINFVSNSQYEYQKTSKNQQMYTSGKDSLLGHHSVATFSYPVMFPDETLNLIVTGLTGVTRVTGVTGSFTAV